jgi:preprotein translocase subunit SecD
VPLLILVIGVLAIYIDMPGAHFAQLSNIDAGLGQKLDTKLGLDLQGGLSITYKANPPAGKVVTLDQMEVIRTIMELRVNTTGVSEPLVERVGSDGVVVQVPGAANPDEIRALVGKTGKLSFVLLPKASYGVQGTPGAVPVPGDGAKMEKDPAFMALLANAQFTGGDLDANGVSASADTQHVGFWKVNFAFAGTKGDEFATWTGAHINEFFAIVLDTTVISAPYIKSAITGGAGEISGSFSVSDAKSLATIMQYGALPYPVVEAAESQIPATLGKTFLNQTLFAGAIGIGLVLLFMLVYYRLPGLVAGLALTYYAVTVLAVFRIVPVTLTLAGIAAFVISVGMAVDANILIFERTKEELRAGKTLATASEAGFNRAWNSIFDSNVSSLITASILYFGGSSTIKGFALVLIIGVATSMFTAVTVSRTLMRVVVRQSFAQKAWLFGVTDAEFQARAMGGRVARRETRGRV